METLQKIVTDRANVFRRSLKLGQKRKCTECHVVIGRDEEGNVYGAGDEYVGKLCRGLHIYEGKLQKSARKDCILFKCEEDVKNMEIRTEVNTPGRVKGALEKS